VRLCAANVTVYILAPPDPPLHFVPPLGNNRTYVVYLKEPYPEVDPVGSVVFQPSVRDVDNASAVFRFQLNCTDNDYLVVDPNTGNALDDPLYYCRSRVALAIARGLTDLWSCLLVLFLWPPYGIGQAIIFLSCSLFFLSFFFFFIFIADSQRSEIGCLPYFHDPPSLK